MFLYHLSFSYDLSCIHCCSLMYYVLFICMFVYDLSFIYYVSFMNVC